MARSDTPPPYNMVELERGGAQNIVIKDKLSFRRQKITFVFLIIMLRVLLFVYCFQGSDGGYRWHVIRGISCRCKAVAMFS